MASTVKSIGIKPFVQALPPTLRNAAHRPLKKEMLLVEVILSSGAIGVGECWTAEIGNESLTEVVQKRLSGRLINLSCGEARETLQFQLQKAIFHEDKAMASAISGLDCALWDSEAREAKISLCELLGGKARDVYTYASGGLYDDAQGLKELAEEACGYVAQGFDAVKIKVAGLSLTEDAERVKTVRKAIGPDVKLMIDANAAYTAQDALSMSRMVLDQDIYWFEEPCTEGLAELRPECEIPICGYEREFGRQKFFDLVQPGLIDFVQFDLSMCGGITEALEILAIAGKLPVTLHGSSSVVLYNLNLQFAAAFGQIESVEYHMVHQWPIDGIEACELPIS